MSPQVTEEMEARSETCYNSAENDRRLGLRWGQEKMVRLLIAKSHSIEVSRKQENTSTSQNQCTCGLPNIWSAVRRSPCSSHWCQEKAWLRQWSKAQQVSASVKSSPGGHEHLNEEGKIIEIRLDFQQLEKPGKVSASHLFQAAWFLSSSKSHGCCPSH